MMKRGMLKPKMGKMKKVMKEYKSGKLHSGSKKGPLVKKRKQAIAIGLSEQRKAGSKISASSKKSGKYKQKRYA